jgi:hypothetical protein
MEAASQVIDALQSYETIYSMLPRFRMNAAVLLVLLQKYQKSNFNPGADLRISLDEMRRLAAETGYPLEQMLSERGLTKGASDER